MKRFSRRRAAWLRQLPGLLVLLGMLAGPVAAEGEAPLTVVSWGGVYEQSQQAAYFTPFTAETGIALDVRKYNGGLAALRKATEGGSSEWDVIDMVMADARVACAAGLLEPLSPDMLEPAPDGTRPDRDFLEGSFTPCAISQLVYATVIAYDDRQFPGIKPTTVADFFDVERFPGKRAIRRSPNAILEWALLSYGVPTQQIYDLLSTERGLALAFRRLGEIREHIVWWEDAAEPARLLAQGAVAMASGFNGRFFDALAVRDAPITIIWDGQLLDYDVWAIPKGADDPHRARQFIAFATRPDRMAALASRIAYGPVRHSARKRVGLHPEAGIPMLDHLPSAPRHLAHAIRQDHEWYARTRALRWRRFEAWLAEDAAKRP